MELVFEEIEILDQFYRITFNSYVHREFYNYTKNIFPENWIIRPPILNHQGILLSQWIAKLDLLTFF